MTTSAERTIGLGHQVGLAHLAQELGLGERREKNRRLPGMMQGPSGWFVSPEELEQIEAEQAKRVEARRDARLKRRRDQRQRDNAARPKPRPPRERAVETWRRECADPMSTRTPLEAWEYACASTIGLAQNSPMPNEQPPTRLSRTVVVLEIAGRRDGSEHGRAETTVERNARYKRESSLKKRTPSAATSGAGGRK